MRLFVKIFWLPDFLTRSKVDFNGRIQHQVRRRVAIINRCRINEGLECRTRLALGLRGAIKFRKVERKSADHGKNTARVRIHCDKRAGNIRDLTQSELPRFIGWFGINDITCGQ